MKFFKKALVASAILGATNVAYAADLTDAVTKTSVQGLEIGAVSDTSLRVIVREQLEAGDKITLVFGKGVAALTTATFGGVSAGAGNMGIVYGSGTYTMGNAVFTANADGTTSVTFEVLTGDPVTKDSSFEVSITGADIDKTKVAQATVTYSAESGLTGEPKDTTGDNVGLLVTTADQYAASIKAKANGVINRDPATSFISGGTAANNDIDTLVVSISDNQDLLSAAVGGAVVATVTVEADIAYLAANTAPSIVGVSSAGDTVSAITPAADEKSFTFTVTDLGADGIAGDITITFDTDALDAGSTETIPVTDFVVSMSVDADSGSATNTPLVTLDKADAGEWELDATIVNVPYFPVGFEGVSSQVNFSNEAGADVDVIVTAIDDSGESYGPLDLGFDLAEDSVVKVSQAVIMDLFEITAPTKLSVTFNIDADKGDVNAHAFTTSAAGRTEIATSQQNNDF
ncbi:hypothetical protein [Colwellia sp. MEBiC06753]